MPDVTRMMINVGNREQKMVVFDWVLFWIPVRMIEYRIGVRCVAVFSDGGLVYGGFTGL